MAQGTPDIFPQPDVADLFDVFDAGDDLGLTETDVSEPLPYGFTWKYDFNNEDLDFSAGNPPIARGHDTLDEWITHTINTEQFETPIFGADVGTRIFSLVGSILDTYVMQRCRDEVLNAISIHDRIETIDNIVTFALNGSVYAHFSYSTDDEIEGQSLIQVG